MGVAALIAEAQSPKWRSCLVFIPGSDNCSDRLLGAAAIPAACAALAEAFCGLTVCA